MNIRKIVKQLTPHGIIMSKNRNCFLKDYDQWKAEGGHVDFDKTCRFDSFVTIDGFGSSGSSAVMDMLREYDGCTVWATKPGFTDKGANITELGEMNLARLPGGLLFIEKMMEEDAVVNVFWSDEAVKSYINLVYYYVMYKNKDIRELFFAFFENIVAQRLKAPKGAVNSHLNMFSSVEDVFYLKPMSKDEYHTLCRNFLYTLFNRLFPDAKGGCLVLDHIFDDCGLDMKRFEPYLPGIKRIKVRRDIRGVYVDAVRHDYRWLAHDTVEDFITWERFTYNGHSDDNTTYLTVRFENLVSDYDYEVARIEKYLELKEEQHTLKKELFNPEISKKNIRVWEQHPELEKETKAIKDACLDLCYLE